VVKRVFSTRNKAQFYFFCHGVRWHFFKELVHVSLLFTKFINSFFSALVKLFVLLLKSSLPLLDRVICVSVSLAVIRLNSLLRKSNCKTLVVLNSITSSSFIFLFLALHFTLLLSSFAKCDIVEYSFIFWLLTNTAHKFEPIVFFLNFCIKLKFIVKAKVRLLKFDLCRIQFLRPIMILILRRNQKFFEILALRFIGFREKSNQLSDSFSVLLCVTTDLLLLISIFFNTW